MSEPREPTENAKSFVSELGSPPLGSMRSESNEQLRSISEILEEYY